MESMSVLVIIIILGFSCLSAKGIIVCPNHKVDIPRPPSQVMVRNRKDFYSSCGGTILNHRHVLTTGVCVTRVGIDIPYKGEVVAGTWDRLKWAPVQRTRSILTIHKHPYFRDLPENDGNFYSNDLAILEIHSWGDFDGEVSYVSIGQNLNSDDTFTISGWGRLNMETNDVADWLRLTEIKLLSRCTVDNRYWKVGMICGACVYGTAEHSTYMGDEGGALVSERDGMAYGMYSWKAGRNYNSVFVDLTRYREWLTSFEPTRPPPTTTTTTTLRPTQQLIAVK